MHDQGKRKVVDSVEAAKSCKFKADTLALKAALEIEAKMRQRDKMFVQRLREKQRMEEIEKELQELKRQLK